MYLLFSYIFSCLPLQVLDVIAPPYTTEFVQALMPLIENEDITGSLRNDDENDLVSEFIGKCSEMPLFLLLGGFWVKKSIFPSSFNIHINCANFLMIRMKP